MINQTLETICPICGKENNCMAHSDELCWCNDMKIPNELLDLFPETKRGKACICKHCIQSYKNDPVKFKSKL